MIYSKVSAFLCSRRVDTSNLKFNKPMYIMKHREVLYSIIHILIYGSIMLCMLVFK